MVVKLNDSLYIWYQSVGLKSEPKGPKLQAQIALRSACKQLQALAPVPPANQTKRIIKS